MRTNCDLLRITLPEDIPLKDGGAQGVIERMKKVRALNCDPADVGIDSYVWKRLSLRNGRSRS